MNENYIRQVKSLLSILPSVNKEKCFALKGGTAINFFWRDLPRLSVDIDLTYLPIQERRTSLLEINRALKRITKDIRKLNSSTRFIEKKISGDLCIALSVLQNDTLVKIEPNTVLRGNIFPTCQKDISPEVEKSLDIPSFVSVTSLSKAELYGGKIIAALDRQHPRDLFDVKLLLDNEGITDDIKTAFVIYLAGHNRPMHEVLKPQPRDMKAVYENEFAGMARLETTLDDLLSARKSLLTTIPKILNNQERQFLISIKQGKPKWNLLPVKGTDTLPAIQWKLKNIAMLDKKKHMQLLNALKKVLE